MLEKRSTLERLPDKDSEEAKALQEEIRVHEAEVSRMKPEGIGDGECFPNDKFAMHPTFIASNSYLDSRPENRGPNGPAGHMLFSHAHDLVVAIQNDASPGSKQDAGGKLSGAVTYVVCADAWSHSTFGRRDQRSAGS